MVVEVEGKELRAKTGKKGWAGWIPKSEGEKLKFQELALYPGDGRDGMGEDWTKGLAALQERLEEAATVV